MPACVVQLQVKDQCDGHGSIHVDRQFKYFHQIIISFITVYLTVHTTQSNLKYYVINQISAN